MNLAKVRWRLAIVGFLAAEVAMIAAAFGWVAIYSYFINPGHPDEFYNRYAQQTIPYLAMLLGIPVFFFTCRWMGLRAPSSAQATALAFFGIFCVIELSMWFAPNDSGISPWFEAINIPVKLLSCLWGARTAQPAA